MIEKLRQDIAKAVSELGYYLYDVELDRAQGETVLRILIDNDDHITLDDCVAVSDHLNPLLDEWDPIEEPYNLEISSAGAEHELRSSDEIKRSIGKDIYVETFEQKLTGRLKSYKNGVLELEHKNRKTTTINEMDINFIRLAIVL